MIFEWRIYDLAPGAALTYLRRFHEQGVALITPILPMGGYFMTESGVLNRIHHLWIYQDFEERRAARGRLAECDPWSKEFYPSVLPMIRGQQNGFLALRQSSALLDMVSERRTHPHEAMAPERPLFAPGLFHMDIKPFSASAAPGLIGEWHIASGFSAGMYLSLRTAYEDALSTPPPHGTVLSELLKPMLISPIQ